jgi:hypothetical protein
MSSDHSGDQPAYSGLAGLLSMECWGRLKIQISLYNQVVAIDQGDYDAWAQETRDAIAQMYM